MRSVRVEKKALLETLRANREEHRKIFLEAQDGFRLRVVAALESALSDARNGKRVETYYQFDAPVDQTRDYDKSISMLERSVDDVVELDANTYANLVLDQWGWSTEFLTSNAIYSATAAAILGGR